MTIDRQRGLNYKARMEGCHPMGTLPMDTLEGTMKTTLEFLDAVKAKHGLTSDYQLSKLLECTHSAISNYRAGKSRLDEETACKVADLLGIEAGFVLSCIAAERSKNTKVKAAWEWTANHLGGLAAALAVLAVIPFLPSYIMSAPALFGDGGSLALIGLTLGQARQDCILCQMSIMYY